MILKDQTHRTLELFEIPKRIISLVPSQTELLVDLGLKDSLVGITKFCVHPKQLRIEKTIVGGTKNVNYEKIKTLKPDIIICNKEENTREMVAACEEITSVYVSDIFTLDDNFRFIKDLGIIFDMKVKASQLVSEIQQEIDNFKSFIQVKPKQKVAYFIWRNPWMVTASDTFINELLELNRYVNTFESRKRYPKIDLEELSTLNLDLILLSSEPYPFNEKHTEEIKKYTNAKIVFVDGEYFSWFGSRLLKALNYFKTLH